MIDPEIKKVYEKFEHLDKLLSDREWSEEDLAWRTCTELWLAVKNHVEKNQNEKDNV